MDLQSVSYSNFPPMATLPGHAGWPVTGDKSWEFYKDPMGFISRRVAQYQSAIFTARFLNKPTVFVTSNAGVWQVLQDDTHMDLGYKAFMHGIYGNNVIFTEGADAKGLRDALAHSLSTEQIRVRLDKIVNRLTEQTLKRLSTRDPVVVYSMFKSLATRICLEVFLDLDCDTSEEIAERISALSVTHWHGIISVPLNIKLPVVYGQGSTYNRALRAKEQLLAIIKQRLADKKADGFLHQVIQEELPEDTPASHHILLFTSALVPKGIASLLTSFVMATAARADILEAIHEDLSRIEPVLLEVQRMWPPIIGGRRLVRKTCEIGGFTVPAGHAVVYMSHHAQRDPDVFPDPNDFKPDRWLTVNANDHDKLCVFGGGPRDCIGQHIVKSILKTVCRSLVKQFTWHLLEGEEHAEYKWLPVSRPREDARVYFHPLSNKKLDTCCGT